MTEQRTITTPRYPGYGIEADLADLLENELQRYPRAEDIGSPMHSSTKFQETADAVLDLLRRKGVIQ